MSSTDQFNIANISVPVAEICSALVSLQRRRTFCIRMQSRCDRAVDAFARTTMGFRTDLPETDRKRISDDAKKLVKQITDDKPITVQISDDKLIEISVIVENNNIARQCWDNLLDKIKDEIIELAQQLPVYQWIQGVRGVTALGLGVIIGETGDMSLYDSESKINKRLGLAVIEGYRQGRLPPNLDQGERKAAWIARGYNPHRRAEVYAFIDDVMLRQQYQGGITLGPYGEHYVRKKEEYLRRFEGEKGDKGHADNAARRYMAKKFVRDLWRAWNEHDWQRNSLGLY